MATMYTSIIIDEAERRKEDKKVKAYLKQFEKDRAARTEALLQMREEINKPLILPAR